MNSIFGKIPPFHRVKSYLSYRMKATNLHGIHPPFLYQLAEQSIYSRKKRYFFDEMNKRMAALASSKEELTITDLGAGSTINSQKVRKVSDIHINSGKPTRIREIMLEWVDYLKLENRVELGTSLGVTTAYLHAPVEGRTITLEGCLATAAYAKKNWKEWGIDGIELVEGNFDETLEGVLDDLGRVDLFYVDGNHRKEPTLRYFDQALNYASSRTVFIFDDIYWSEGMAEAWEAIKKDRRVSLTVDLYEIGMAMIDPALSKQDFVLKY